MTLESSCYIYKEGSVVCVGYKAWGEKCTSNSALVSFKFQFIGK